MGDTRLGAPQAAVITVGTYNIHKCKGMDALVRPNRIASVLRSTDADLWALQEVLLSQAQEIHRCLPAYSLFFGRAREHACEPYGNATLSRLPVVSSRAEVLSVAGKEPRSALLTVIESGPVRLNFRNVHLGTSYDERTVQARALVSRCEEEHDIPQILAGDFNDWSAGSSIRILDRNFEHLRKARLARSYPGLLPLMHLDQMYFRGVALVRTRVVRTRLTMVASDHVPIVAEFSVP